MNFKNIWFPTQRKARPEGCWGASLLLMALLLAGCGTTSGLKGTAGNSSLDLSLFDRVVVRDFVDKASEHAKDSDRQRKQARMRRVTKDFADMLAWEIGQGHAFQQVVRNGTEDEKTLLLAGQITRFEEGEPNLSLWMGMGAGSSFLDSRVDFIKGGSGSLFVTIVDNSNSFVLA